ncbi:hypothetical protein NDU88_000213 [Pleurodeles waltl]|uniref:Uncharacterized protein n=1 Tax=Pleurodeles waltl TaxID=8319 RepID=A0AAV7KLN4_PLEWA|nr:hypothetical protein NDU88_000213 [Pleurodeles waltl]
MVGADMEGPHHTLWGEDSDDPPDDTCWTEGYSEVDSDTEGSPGRAACLQTDVWPSDGTLGGFSAFHLPVEHRVGVCPRPCIPSPHTAAAPGREIPCCAVPPTFCRSPWTPHPAIGGSREPCKLVPRQPPPCNLAISHSNRTFSHPSFQSYYTAVALWNFGAKENGPCKDPTRPATDGNIKQPVLPIDTSDFFFTDPLLPPGHRVYNCLSSRSQQELQEAEELLIRLNQNFAYWAERTGEVEKLAMVWGTFQDQLSVFSGLVAWQSEQMDSVNESCFGLSTDDTETLQQHSEVPHRSNKELPH